MDVFPKLEMWTPAQALNTSSYTSVWSTPGNLVLPSCFYYAMFVVNTNDVWLKTVLNDETICELTLSTLTSDFALGSPHVLTVDSSLLIEYSVRSWCFRPPAILRVERNHKMEFFMKAVSGNKTELVRGMSYWGKP